MLKNGESTGKPWALWGSTPFSTAPFCAGEATGAWGGVFVAGGEVPGYSSRGNMSKMNRRNVQGVPNIKKTDD